MRRLWLVAVLCGFAALAQAEALRPFGADSPAALKKSLAGRPFVLSFWSVTCEPCVREMPVWREMRARHPGVEVILVATDAPERRERVLEFLRRFDPGAVQRWQFADNYEERIRHAIDPKWRGELPRTYFFDASHRSTAATGLVEREDAERWFARAAGKAVN